MANVAISAGYEIECFIDEDQAGKSLLGYEIVGNVLDHNSIQGLNIAIAIGDNAVRQRVHESLSIFEDKMRFPALVHSSATISSFSEIAEGAVIMPNAVVGPNTKIGRFCLVNTSSVIDHDSHMLEYSSIAPGALIGGRVSIGTRAAVSIGATVSHGIEIGDDCVVGANSFLNKDLEANRVAYGIPAKVIRTRKIGDRYLS